MANVIAYGFSGSGHSIESHQQPQWSIPLHTEQISQNPNAAPNDLGEWFEPLFADVLWSAALMDPLPSTGGAGGPHSYANII